NTNVGTADQPIAYVAYPGASALISNPAPTGGTAQGGFSINASDVVIAGFSFENISNAPPIGVYNSVGVRIVANSASGGTDGINVNANGSPGSAHVKVFGNYVHHGVGSGCGGGAAADQSQSLVDVEVAYNEYSSNPGTGGFCFGTSNDPGDNLR